MKKLLAVVLVFLLVIPGAVYSKGYFNPYPLSVKTQNSLCSFASLGAYGFNMPLLYASDEPELLPLRPIPMPLDATEEPFRFLDDQMFMLLSFIISPFTEYELDEETMEVTMTNRNGNTLVFTIEEADGFINDGAVWVPFDFYINYLSEFIFARYVAPRVDRINLTLWDEENFADIRGISHTTDMPHGEIAVYYIRFMSEYLPGRSPFSYAELDAAIWIVEELLAMGHNFDNIKVQEFTYWDINEYYDIWVWWDIVTWPNMLGEGLLREDRVSQNVVLTLPGVSEKMIIVGAHYDSLAYPGASDNASGTALLLESAFRMLELDHYYTIVYVFFGAEEVGLIGAHYFYAKLSEEQRDNIVLMINADVLIEGPYMIYGAGALPRLEDGEEIEYLRELVIYETIQMMNRWNEEFLEQMERTREQLIYELEQRREQIIYEFDEIPVFHWDELEIFEGASEVIIHRHFIFGDYEDAYDFVFVPFDWFDADVFSFEPDFEWMQDLPDSEVLARAFAFGIIPTALDVYALRVSEIAAELSLSHDFELISIPEAIKLSSDQLVFLNAGFTVVMLAGFERVANVDRPGFLSLRDEFTLTILHSPQDEFYYIEDRWPGMMLNNLRGFGLLLEGILTAWQ